MNNDIYIDLLDHARKIIGHGVALRVELDPNGDGLNLVAGRPGLEHDFDYVSPDKIRPFLTLGRGDSVAAIVAQLDDGPTAARVKVFVVRELERSRRGNYS